MRKQAEDLSNPFPGLRPFMTEEYEFFFGRDGQSEALVKKLEANHFVAVVGSSGSGKSSLVRAGLLPALYGGRMESVGSCWRMAIFRPGDNPTRNLARALSAPDVLGSLAAKTADLSLADIEATLRRSSLGLIDVVRLASMLPHENLLITVDQFEEIFAQKQSSNLADQQQEAVAFVKLLLEAINRRDAPIYAVITMRSDYLGQCAQFRELPEAINSSQYLVPRMNDDERREAITGPIAISEGSISLPLVNRLLNDAGDNPDQLPILQHAMMRTWDEWRQTRSDLEPIDISHYENIGGMTSALSQDADKAYDGLCESRQKIAEKMFKCLTERDSDNREIRRPATVKEICEVAQADQFEVLAVIEAFRSERRSFLMIQESAETAENLRIDISHESLIRGWKRLGKWVDEEAQSARQYKKIAEAAAEYDQVDDVEQKKEYMMTGPALQLALDWRERHRPNKYWAARYHPEFEKAMSFLDESRAAREAALALRERQQRERAENEQKQKLSEIEQQRIEERLAQAQALAAQKTVATRRMRIMVMVMGVTSLIATGAAVMAVTQRSEAVTQRSEAVAALKQAQEERERADAEREEAKRQADIAQERSEFANYQSRIAGEKAKEAEAAQQKLAETQRKAEAAHLLAQKQIRDLSEQRGDVLKSLGGLYGEAFTLANDPDKQPEALEKFDTIVGLYEGAEVRPGVVTTLISKAQIYNFRNTDQAKNAEKDYEKIIDTFKDMDGYEQQLYRPQKFTAFMKLGRIRLNSTDTNVRLKAAENFEEALQLLSGLDDQDEFDAHFALGKLYSEAKNPRIRYKAIENYESVISILDQSLFEHKSEYQRVFYIREANLGLTVLYKEFNQQLKSEGSFARALEASQRMAELSGTTPDSATEADLRIDISLKYKALGDSANFEETIKQALAAYNSRNVNDPQLKAQVFQRVAGKISDSGDKKTAVDYYNQTLPLFRSIGDSKGEASSLFNLGKCYEALKNYEQAVNAYQQALTLYKAMNDNSRIANTYFGLGTSFKSMNQNEQARSYLNEALELYKLLKNRYGQSDVNEALKKIPNEK